MKRNRIGSTLAGLLLTVTAGAQIPNSGFETLTVDDKISQWGKTFLMMVIIDSNGNSISDSIVMDNAWYFATPEAHSGQWAMEMRNAYNYNSGDQFAGGAFLSADESYSNGFMQLVEIAPVQPPERLTFWYQFIPAGPDTATAVLALYDVDGIQIGEANVRIGQTTNGYTLADVPVAYTQLSAVHYITMAFSTNVPYGPATFGTRFPRRRRVPRRRPGNSGRNRGNRYWPESGKRVFGNHLLRTG
jgi:hypothetical protein